jgi:S-adenosylmethionine synthetase
VNELNIRRLEGAPPGRQAVEVVERKGLGHPDTICDAIAEHVCVRLCTNYLDRFGFILHHNVDKVLLVGGIARPSFGGGEVLEPIELYLAGRVTSVHRGVRIPTSEIAAEAAREWLTAHVPGIDPIRGVRIVPRLRGGSSDLTALFARGMQGRALANDTSCGVGFAPLSDLERVVLAAERALNASETKRQHPALGEDVKVMGLRRGRHIQLTVACAMIGRHLSDLDAYLRAKETARSLVVEAARSTSPLDVEVEVNAADRPGVGEVFLTVTGTSAEAGDDGEVGRGNRANGLITPGRAMTLEAAAGKNPATHVGKLYSVIAGRIARGLTTLPGVADATCTLVSRIGQPLDLPQLADLQLDTGEGGISPELHAQSADVVREKLASIDEVRDDLLREREAIF